MLFIFKLTNTQQNENNLSAKYFVNQSGKSVNVLVQKIPSDFIDNLEITALC